jgi:ring-1,2-phenylacetyl-CoA epoxidase subunit PaaD
VNKEQIIEILSEVKDPEIPVLTISDLGILREVSISGDLIHIKITPTYSGCPAMTVIEEDIRLELAKHGLKNVEVKQVLSPAWTSDWMTASGKEKLEAYGIAAPMSHHCINGNDEPEQCPHCRSKNIEMISRFGSTACKALYRCKDCLEPFDYFKCH